MLKRANIQVCTCAYLEKRYKIVVGEDDHELYLFMSLLQNVGDTSASTERRERNTLSQQQVCCFLPRGFYCLLPSVLLTLPLTHPHQRGEKQGCGAESCVMSTESCSFHSLASLRPTDFFPFPRLDSGLSLTRPQSLQGSLIMGLPVRCLIHSVFRVTSPLFFKEYLCMCMHIYRHTSMHIHT